MKKRLCKVLIIILVAVLLFYEIDIYMNKRVEKKRVISYVKYSSTHNYYYKPLIVIPSIDLKAMVEKANDDFSNLDKSLVYYKTFDPDKKMVIFGHSGAGYGTYFNRINEIDGMDYLYIYYQDKCYKYDFYYSKYIDETDVGILKTDDDNKVLYLVTCTKKDRKRRLLVAFRQKNAVNAQKISKK